MFLARSLVAWILFFGAGPVAVAAGPVEVTVDCDAGEDLAATLSAIETEAAGPLTVHVVGTCSGPIEITTDDVTLRGKSTDASAIQGVRTGVVMPTQAIVTAHGVRRLRLENLRISGGPVGVAVGDAEVTIEDCDLDRMEIGIISRDSTVALTRATLRDSRTAIEACRSRVDVSFSTIEEISDEGISATEYSRLLLFKTAIVSDGLSVGSSTLVATLCELEGSIHARSYSRVSLAGAAGSGAALHGNIFASNSEVFLFRLPVDGSVRVGESGLLTVLEAEVAQVLLGPATNARISAGTVRGDLRADGFSTVQLSSAIVGGDLVCERGSDAYCELSEVASVWGCGGCSRER
jgi:hypothetical protein